MNRIPEANPDWSSDRPDPSSSCAPYRLYNIGNNQPVALMDFVKAIETALGKKAQIEYLPLQPGDVPATYADVSDLMADTGFKPSTPVPRGIQQFVDWYLAYYGH
jgi:UDP-glucuronate 4-epimerase